MVPKWVKDDQDVGFEDTVWGGVGYAVGGKEIDGGEFIPPQKDH